MVGAYIYQAALLCVPCGRLAKQGVDTGDSDDYPQGPYPDGGGEADTPQYCDSCFDFLENPLTLEGYAYVSEALSEAETLTPVLQEWQAFYGRS